MEIDRPIFVIGVPRSGTTVVYEAFSQHEDLAWISNHATRVPWLNALHALPRLYDMPLIGRLPRSEKPQGQARHRLLNRQLLEGKRRLRTALVVQWFAGGLGG